MATLKYLLDVTAPDAKKTFDQIGGRMAELDKSLQKTRDLSIGDRQAMATFTRLQAQADRLKDKISGMPLTIEGAAKAEGQLLGVEATADRLDRKLGGKGIGGGRGGILGLLSGAGGAIGAGGSAVGGVVSAIGQNGQAALIGGGVATAAAAGPAAIPLALGAGFGGLGAFLAAGKQIGKIFHDSFAIIKQDVAPLRPLFVAVFQPLTGLAKSIGPALRDVFAETVPYLKTFVGLLKPAAAILLPAISQSLRQFQPFLPLIATGLLRVVKGFAGLLNALGPQGMQDATKIFIVATKVIEFALVAVGKTMNALAVGIVKGVHDIATWWDWLSHHTATVFDGIRHLIATDWDTIYQDSIGRVIRLAHNVETQFNSMRHGIADVFDGLRHDLASAWDAIWNNTVGRAIRGVQDVQNVIRKIPGWLKGFFAAAGSWLIQGGKNIIAGLWNGIKDIWNSVIGWLKGLPGKILGALGIHSPPPWAIDAGKHIMGGITRGLKLGAGDVLKFVAGLPGRIGSMAAGFLADKFLGGAGNLPPGVLARFGAGGSGVVALGEQMAALKGWTGSQWSALYALWQRESGWNPAAQNPTSGAAGIPQDITGNFHGGAAGQIAWGLNYIAGRYGSPLGAWAHEERFGWYGSGLKDGLFTRPTIIGVGERGPERVNITPASQGSGQKIVWEVRTGHGGTALDRAVVDIIQNYVTVHGGDAQTALGQRS